MGRDNLDNLLSACIPFAQQMLSKRGMFYPFGSVMAATGEISLAGSYDDNPDITAEEVLEQLLDGFRAHARAGDYEAIAFCVDVRVDAPDGSGKTDAIRVTLEENGGESVNVFMPYRKRIFRGVKYGELFATETDKTVFV